MRRIILAILIISLVPIACSQPPDHTGSPSNPSGPGTQTSPEQPNQDPSSPFTPEELARIEKLKECRKNPSKDGCACILNKSSLECQCSQGASANSKECRCFKNPNDPGCACITNPNGEECYCSKNPAAERCQGPSVEELCRRYCAGSEGDRRDMDNPLTKKLLDADCDHDGLSNGDELEKMLKFSAQLDPCNEDTKGNGIVDSRDNSLEEGDDLDRDGVPDVVEERLDLLKDNAFTPFNGIFGYKDRITSRKPGHRYGKSDGDLWIINACSKYIKQLDSSRPQVLKSQPAADLMVMLPNDSVGKFFPPSASDQTRDAAMLLSSSGQGIFGGLLAVGVESGHSSPTHYLSQLISNLGGKFTNPIVGANKKTHDLFDYAQADIKVAALRSGDNLQKLLFDGISKTLHKSKNWLKSFTNLENELSAGAFVPTARAKNGYALKLTVLYRSHRDDQGNRISTTNVDEAHKDQVIFLYAFAPIANDTSSTAEYSVGSDLVATRLRDLTNTTSITQLPNEIKPICVEKRVQDSKTPVYFYFVIDESGSMDDSNAALIDITQTFFSKVSNTELTFKVGATHLATDSSFKPGSLGGTPGRIPPPKHFGAVARWNGPEEGAEFAADVNILKASSDGGTEEGFRSAREGLEYMTSSEASPDTYIPSNAKVITIFITDESDEPYSKLPNDSAKVAEIASQIDFFNGEKSTVFAIVKEPTSEKYGLCYQKVALGTGGGYAPLSSDKAAYISTLDAIIDEAISATSSNILPQPPISSSLQVFKDISYGGYDKSTPHDTAPLKQQGQFVPRSLKNGFSYSAERNVISFTGGYKPVIPESGKRGEDFIVLYYFYDYRTKAF